MSDYDRRIYQIPDLHQVVSVIEGVPIRFSETGGDDVSTELDAPPSERSVVSQDRATRFNKGKMRPSLIPVEWIEELLVVMEAGAKKYGDSNWKQGMPYKEVLDSLERHLIQSKKREDIDPDDGLRTATKMAVNALFLLYYQLKGMDKFDDR